MMTDTDELICPICKNRFMSYHCCPHSYGDVFAAASEARQWAQRLYQENAELRRQLEVAFKALETIVGGMDGARMLREIAADAIAKMDAPSPTTDGSR